MFFTLSKIIDFILLPITWIIALCLISLLAKSMQTKRIAGISALMIMIIGSNSFIVNKLISAYELPQITLKPTEHYPLGIVLGGGIIRSPQEDPQRINLAESADRCMQAALLYKSGKIDQILITGGNTSIGSFRIDRSNETASVKRLLIQLGIPSSDIMTETQAKNTHENARFSKRIVDSLGIKSPVLLITSAFHMRRAAACYAKVDLPVIPYAVDNKKKDTPLGILEMIIPSEGELQKLAVLIREMSGYLIYQMMGYA